MAFQRRICNRYTSVNRCKDPATLARLLSGMSAMGHQAMMVSVNGWVWVLRVDQTTAEYDDGLPPSYFDLGQDEEGNSTASVQARFAQADSDASNR